MQVKLNAAEFFSDLKIKTFAAYNKHILLSKKLHNHELLK